MMDRADIFLKDGQWHWVAKDAEGNVLLEGTADDEADATQQVGQAFPNQGVIYVDHV